MPVQGHHRCRASCRNPSGSTSLQGIQRPVAGQGLQPILPLIRPAKAGVQAGSRIAPHRQRLPALPHQLFSLSHRRAQRAEAPQTANAATVPRNCCLFMVFPPFPPGSHRPSGPEPRPPFRERRPQAGSGHGWPGASRRAAAKSVPPGLENARSTIRLPGRRAASTASVRQGPGWYSPPCQGRAACSSRARSTAHQAKTLRQCPLGRPPR